MSNQTHTEGVVHAPKEWDESCEVTACGIVIPDGDLPASDTVLTDREEVGDTTCAACRASIPT